MVEPIDVCALLKEYADLEDFSESELLPFCERALSFVFGRLKEGADKGSFLVAEAAAAQARLELFNRMLASPDRFRSYKAGDVTIQRDLQKEFEIEKTLRDEAFLRAAEILKDGGFFFEARA